MVEGYNKVFFHQAFVLLLAFLRRTLVLYILIQQFTLQQIEKKYSMFHKSPPTGD